MLTCWNDKKENPNGIELPWPEGAFLKSFQFTLWHNFVNFVNLKQVSWLISFFKFQIFLEDGYPAKSSQLLRVRLLEDGDVDHRQLEPGRLRHRLTHRHRLHGRVNGELSIFSQFTSQLCSEEGLKCLLHYVKGLSNVRCLESCFCRFGWVPSFWMSEL